ncbi:MAG: zincin-like metallopeptidase domain-containing protein [Prosthecobacter sp.]|nr:zincin-like metallopeptidase domain-containing protein [Prosthecobacter sp.]
MKTATSKAESGESRRFDAYQAVTDTILKKLEVGTVPWRCPWDKKVGRPCNFASNREYQGINVMLLGAKRFASPYWLTMRQANDLGGQVRKGEHGTLIVKYGRHERRTKGKEEETKAVYYLRGYTVFNALQIDGVEFPEAEEPQPAANELRIESAERIVAQMTNKPTIKEGKTVRACYRVSSDTIEMPARSRFVDAESYHLVLFHEIIHSTGHESRLNRKSLMGATGAVMTEYSKEELVAEMGSAFLGMEAGIVQDEHEQSAAYLQCWLDTLREPNHKRWIVEAASHAAKAAHHVLAIE